MMVKNTLKKTYEYEEYPWALYYGLTCGGCGEIGHTNYYRVFDEALDSLVWDLEHVRTCTGNN